MRIRSIKPEFWRSPDISALSIEDRLLFIGLWSYVDDNGVGQDRPSVIAADLFADDLSLDPNETLRRVSTGLQTLSEASLISRYTVGKRDFLHITNWEKHQRVPNPNKPRYPAPTSENVQPREDVRRPYVEPNEDVRPGTGEQGNRGTGDKNTCSPAVSERATARRFDEFWNVYPRKVGKDKARAKYATAVKRATEDEIIAGAHRLAADPNLPEKQFVPHPSTWLERGGWEDEPLPPRTTTGNVLSFDQQRIRNNDAVTARYLNGEPPWSPENTALELPPF